jgi:acyl-CoA thioesterase-1
MTRLAVVALLSLGMLSACAVSGATPARRLPIDRAAAVRYVALGDSTVEGVGASAPDRTYVHELSRRLRAIYPRATVDNLGVAGATSADVLARQLDRALSLAPDLITLSVGPNDVTGRLPIETFERNVETIFRRLHGETRAATVATLMPDLAVTPRFRDAPERDAIARRATAFNEALRRAAKPYGVVLIDLHAPSRAEIPRRPELVASDGYHPSDAGYARWAELMWRAIRPLTAER